MRQLGMYLGKSSMGYSVIKEKVVNLITKIINKLVMQNV